LTCGWNSISILSLPITYSLSPREIYLNCARGIKKLIVLSPFVPSGSCRPLLSVNISAKTSEQNHTNKTDLSKLHWGNINMLERN
jgi:hypothetical protein